MQVELLNDQGQAASKYDAPETVFGREYNEDLVHQIVVAYQANARQGTRAQKDRVCGITHVHKYQVDFRIILKFVSCPGKRFIPNGRPGFSRNEGLVVGAATADPDLRVR
jgi:hypothetical protein